MTLKVDMRTSVRPKYKEADVNDVERGIPDEGQLCFLAMIGRTADEEPAVCTRKRCQMWHRNGNFCIIVACLNSHSYNMKVVGSAAEVEIRKYMKDQARWREQKREAIRAKRLKEDYGPAAPGDDFGMR